MIKGIVEYELETSSLNELSKILDDIMCGKDKIDCLEFLDKCRIYAQELPRALREVFYDFQLREDNYILSIKGHNINSDDYFPTPSSMLIKNEELADRNEVLHLLYSSLLGEPFGWKSIQHGCIINEVFPIQENFNKVVSSGGAHDLGLHTEDAFSPYFGEFLGLMCVKNTYETPTWFSFIDDVRVPEKYKNVLFQERFNIMNNPAHHISSIEEKSAILFGDFESPYIRANFNFIDKQVDSSDQEAKNALNYLNNKLVEHSFEYPLKKGEYIYINNLKVVHGKKKYVPQYDGNDRWMKRIYITESLKKSRSKRLYSNGRVIYPDNYSKELSEKHTY